MMIDRRIASARHRYLLTLVCYWTVFVFVSLSRAWAGTPLGDLAASMKPGTWGVLPTNNINAVLRNTGGSGNMIMGYAENIAWDPVSQQLFFVGSDHGQRINGSTAYNANLNAQTQCGARFVKYVESTNTWSELPRQDFMTTDCGGAKHGYDMMALDPTRRFFFRWVNNAIYGYHIDTGVWNVAKIDTARSYFSYGAIAYFPEMGGVLHAGADSGVYGLITKFTGYSPSNNGTWTLINTKNTHEITQPIEAEYNPVHHVVMIAGGFKSPFAIHRVSADGTITVMSSTAKNTMPVGLTRGMAQNSTLLTVDPVSGDYLVFSNDDQTGFYRYNIITNVWTRIAQQPAFFATSRFLRGGQPLFETVATPISNYGVTMFVQCPYSSGNCLLYLYKATATSSDVTSPSVPTNLTAGSASTSQINLSWSASIDAVGVSGYRIYRDGNFLATVTSGTTYQNTGLSASTPYSYTITAYDAAGNESAHSSTVTATTAASLVPPVGTASVPTLEDERNTYIAWGWTWTLNKEPNFPGDPTYTVRNPNIHGSTEGDDLWTYLMMYRRTGQKGYLDRAQAWLRYFKEDYRACAGTSGATFCHDKAQFGLDHLYGWGLIAWYEYTGDTGALNEAIQIGVVLEGLYQPTSSFSCLPAGACIWYGLRQGGRHLLFATRLAEVTRDSRWITLRDKILNLFMTSGNWDSVRGMYWTGSFTTDAILGTGAYASGHRVQSSMHVAVLAEAFRHVYRVTGRQDVKDRLIAMAAYIDQHGMDPAVQYAGAFFGIQHGRDWFNGQCDPAYTTGLVNLLVMGYNLTGNTNLYNRAKHFFNRGTKGVYGDCSRRFVGDTEVHHFIDTVFDSSAGNFYLGYNKGELQYTYLIFSLTSGSPGRQPPVTPSDLRIK